MHTELIQKDKHIYFGDCVPKYKDIVLDVFDLIVEHENITEELECDKYFTIESSRCMTDGDFDGAFITCERGSYLLHDLQEEQSPDGVETTLFYSLSKIYNK